MDFKGKSVLVTGGAGFIGSHLTEYLVKVCKNVIVIDNFSSGRKENLINILDKLECVKLDLTTEELLNRNFDVDIIFHFAANPEVRVSSIAPQEIFKQNILATFNVLQFMRHKSIKKIVFASTSTVYGCASVMPTPEHYGPLIPISVYGASKLAAESLVASFSHTYKFQSVLLRYANIIGPRSEHGVIYDFYHKLKKNNTELEILGDGTQTKSYLYISDCISATITAVEHSEGHVSIYNIGSDDQISVTAIAKEVISAMNLNDVKLRYTGGVDGGRGWPGDVKYMLLDISKLKKIGWSNKFTSQEAVYHTITQLIKKEQTG
jgi:UDP-glucose 4-epimerase